MTVRVASSTKATEASMTTDGSMLTMTVQLVLTMNITRDRLAFIL